MTRKLVSLLVAVFMVIALVPMSALAQRTQVAPTDVYEPVTDLEAGEYLIGTTVGDKVYLISNLDYVTGEGYTYFTRGIEATLTNGNITGVADETYTLDDALITVTPLENDDAGLYSFSVVASTGTTKVLKGAATYDDLYFAAQSSYTTCYKWAVNNGIASVETGNTSHPTRYITYKASTTYNDNTYENVFWAPDSADGASTLTFYKLGEDTPTDPTEPPVDPTEPPVLNDFDAAANAEGSYIEFTNESQYPWTIETEGERTYVKSGNGGVASSTSSISATVTVPAGGGIVTFDFKAFGEGSYTFWDHCDFSIDGEVVMTYGAYDNDWETFEYELTEGEHALVWSYTKDSSVNPTGDYFAVDNVYVGEPVMPTAITVEDVEVYAGYNKTVNYTFTPANTTDQSVTFEVADTSVATVNENGVITGVAVGTTTVTVTSVVDTTVSGTANVTVTELDLTEAASVTLSVPSDHWGDGSGYQMLLDADANTYNVIIPATGPLTSSGDADPAVYAEFEFTIPEGADGSCNTQNMVNTDSVTIVIPAGVYDYVITNPTPGDRIWIATDNGTGLGRADDFEFVAGCSYVFTVTLDSSTGNDRVDLVIDGDVPTPSTNPTDNPPAPGGETWDFEDSTTTGWTLVDADGDGYNWMLASEKMSTGYGHNASIDCLLSQSYDNNYGVLYPDNWAITPAIEAEDLSAVSFSFYAAAQDNAYASEHFGIYVGNSTTTGSMVLINEYTMTAKTRTQGNWYQFTVDLSGVTGIEAGTIYFAIRHFNCSDMFYLLVDDVTVGGGGGEPGETPDPTTPPAPVTGEVWDFETDPEAQGWQFVDNDGDGENWEWRYGPDWADFNYHEGQGYIMSASYINYVGALNPNNSAFTPEFTVGANGAISFWAQGQDPSYAAEVIGVFVNGTQVGSDITLTGSDTQYTFDLSAYVGQTIRVEIRHYNVTDMFQANLDYVEVTGEGEQPPVEEIPGDADGDGEVTLQDALLIMRYALDIVGEDAIELGLSDVNGDGVVDFVDALLVLRKAMGIIDSFPIED